MSGFQSKRMMAASRSDGTDAIHEYASALLDATVALDEGTATPAQSLIWLQALSEMWVRQSINENS